MSELKVVNFPTKPPTEPQVNPSAVKLAKEILARCESGEIQFFAFLGLDGENAVLSAWTRHQVLRPFVVVGGLEHLKARFMAATIENE